jgi:hypothetical protein
MVEHTALLYQVVVADDRRVVSTVTVIGARCDRCALVAVAAVCTQKNPHRSSFGKITAIMVMLCTLLPELAQHASAPYAVQSAIRLLQRGMSCTYTFAAAQLLTSEKTAITVFYRSNSTAAWSNAPSADV